MFLAFYYFFSFWKCNYLYTLTVAPWGGNWTGSYLVMLNLTLSITATPSSLLASCFRLDFFLVIFL